MLFIDKNHILSDSQYGFRANCSTSFALMELIEEICSGIDDKKITVSVFIYLKKGVTCLLTWILLGFC